MSDADKPILYHSANTRSSGVRVLLEELGVPYEIHVLDMAAGGHRAPAFLAVNPLGKVPTLRHGAAVVTEQVAIFLYLADRFPAAGLAPAIDDPARGEYLRWMVFYAASFEPAVVDRALKREPGQPAMSPYGSFEAVMDAISGQLRKGPYLLGERFSAADILWGAGLGWTTAFGIVPATPEIAAYVKRAAQRSSARFVRAEDQKLAAVKAAPG